MNVSTAFAHFLTIHLDVGYDVRYKSSTTLEKSVFWSLSGGRLSISKAKTTTMTTVLMESVTNSNQLLTYGREPNGNTVCLKAFGRTTQFVLV